jgi:hypothetical protein
MMRLILIPAIMLILALGAAGVVALAYFVIRASQRKASQAGPSQMVLPLSPAPPQDLDQQLRALAKLRDDGVITKEDFDAKKRALLGL